MSTPTDAAQAATLVLTRRDVASLLGPTECRLAVAEAFRRHGSGEADPPALLGFHVEGGGLHVKVGRFDDGGDEFVVVKTNANFPHNPMLRGLPTVQGVVQVFDARSGEVVALMDSIEVTTLRTAAASAVAGGLLARADAAVMTIAGCGVQGRAHVRAMAEVRRIDRLLLWDRDPAAAERLAAELTEEDGPDVSVLDRLADGVRQSDMVVTCTPSHEFLVEPECVPDGCFIAAVGADNEEKRELAPGVLAGARVVADVVEQCERIGDLHHAIEAGAMSAEDVHAELGQIVAGQRPGRTTDDEIFIFDSTGMALQDAAAVVEVIRRAHERGLGAAVDLSGID